MSESSDCKRQSQKEEAVTVYVEAQPEETMWVFSLYLLVLMIPQTICGCEP